MIRVYGSKISYFTGKLEAYLRYRGIAYELLPLSQHRKQVRAHVGAMQMPVVELEDGRWMSDTTPIIQYLERESPEPPVIPDDPILRFVGLLLEDYADEWLWRPAMHYRWSHRHDRRLLSGLIVDELLGHIPLPRFAKLLLIRRRQRGGFVRGDGVSDATRHHVELSYFAALENMSHMLEGRRFLLGDSPSIADIGLMGPMLRHFGQDPTPAELMRARPTGLPLGRANVEHEGYERGTDLGCGPFRRSAANAPGDLRDPSRATPQQRGGLCVRCSPFPDASSRLRVPRVAGVALPGMVPRKIARGVQRRERRSSAPAEVPVAVSGGGNPVDGRFRRALGLRREGRGSIQSGHQRVWKGCAPVKRAAYWSGV